MRVLFIESSTVISMRHCIFWNKTIRMFGKNYPHISSFLHIFFCLQWRKVAIRVNRVPMITHFVWYYFIVATSIFIPGPIVELIDTDFTNTPFKEDGFEENIALYRVLKLAINLSVSKDNFPIPI